MRAKILLYQPVLFVGLLSLLTYTWATLRLGSSPSVSFLLLLAAPCAIYIWFFRTSRAEPTLKNSRAAIILLVYVFLYCLGIYFLPVLVPQRSIGRYNSCYLWAF